MEKFSHTELSISVTRYFFLTVWPAHLNFCEHEPQSSTQVDRDGEEWEEGIVIHEEDK